jgi:putative CocE/NonD family hydrolase
MIQRIDVSVKMRDGVALSTDIRMPDGPGPFPVIVVRTPYNNTGFAAGDCGIPSGYAVVKQDCRGRFDSEGRFNPFFEAEDGADTLAWVKAQPWCDGRLGMLGNSYCATAQLTAAWSRPPGLLAITPGVMGCDLFKDLIYYNGVFNLSLAFVWGMAVSGRSGQTHDTTDLQKVFRHLPLETMDEAAGFHAPHFREWLAHPLYDAHWAAASVERHYADFDLPILHSGGWYDFYGEGTTLNFAGIRAKGGPRARAAQRLVMGPWQHGLGGRQAGQLDFGESAVTGMDGLYKRWIDRWVLGMPNGADREAPVRIFIMGTNVWRDEQEWPLARAVETDHFLGSRGAANTLYGDGVLLGRPAGGSDCDRYVYNPENPAPTMGGAAYSAPGGPTDHAPLERREDVLVYTGERLDAPMEVTGPVRAVLFVSSDCVDTDFVVRLCDVHPDGRSIILCDGIARARLREGLDREVMMKPGEVYELAVPMGVTANVFLPGHRVRVEVTSSCFPRFARNLNTGEPVASGTRMKMAAQAVWHSGAKPSRVILPVVEKKNSE